MKFPEPLIAGKFLRRYQRFFADVMLENGCVVTAHCANSGSMKTCYGTGEDVWLRYDPNPKRKLAYTWLLASVGGSLIFVHPVTANRLAREAIECGTIRELSGYEQLRTEPRLNEHTRLDLLLERGREKCFVEVKSATLLLETGRIAFPDAVSARATKHLEELVKLVRSGHRAVLLFCANRTDASSVQAAQGIDPTYARTLSWAVDEGVEVLAYRAAISTTAVELCERIPVVLVPLA